MRSGKKRGERRMSIVHFISHRRMMSKELIFNHPLFPFLTTIFEKCQLATLHLPVIDDVRAFFRYESTNRRITTENEQIDQLMIEAIRILHIHLKELEKVNELTENFCEKYVQMLNERMSTCRSFRQSSISDEENEENVHQPKKRGIFPQTATSLLRTWLFDHLHYPYPSDEEKRRLAEETQLSVVQVNNWFINARRRIVQPMIDHSNVNFFQ